MARNMQFSIAGRTPSIVYEPFDDGWPGYEDPSIMLN